MLKILAFDTSTEQLSVALHDGQRMHGVNGPGGAQASAALLPAIESLLAQAGLTVAQLDLIAFGQGPGSFTGLRTACSVAQGLAHGAGRPVVPVPTLLAIGAQAHQALGEPLIAAALDARMNEIYLAHLDFNAPLEGQVRAARDAHLLAPRDLTLAQSEWLAGNTWPACASELQAALGADPATRHHAALPEAQAAAELAARLAQAGHSVPAAQALPLYVRDKVALTTAEREGIKSAP